MSTLTNRLAVPARPLFIVFIAALMTVVVSVSASASGGATIAGTVTLTAADGGTFPGEGARLTLACPADGTTTTEVSDEHGAFRFLNVPVDTCSIQADLQGFAGQPVGVVTAAEQVVWTDLHLGIAPLRAGVNVGGTTPVQQPGMPPESCPSDARSAARAIGEKAHTLTPRPATLGSFRKKGHCHVTSND
jgi:hypothetical protein